MPPVNLPELLEAKSALKTTPKPKALSGSVKLPSFADYRRDYMDKYEKEESRILEQMAEELVKGNQKITIYNVWVHFKDRLIRDLTKEFLNQGYPKNVVRIKYLYHSHLVPQDGDLLIEIDVDKVMTELPEKTEDREPSICLYCKTLDFDFVAP